MVELSDYHAFLQAKQPKVGSFGFDPAPMNPALFDFQQEVTAFCIKKGRAALFLDTGLGKSLCILEWCKQMAAFGNGYALILTPLAVAKQFEREAAKFGFNARVVRHAKEVKPGISICNYDRLDLLDPSVFGSVALDESSILKSQYGKTKNELVRVFAETPFRLCATATPAPNDHSELGSHAEFLGIMSGMEMLSRWFINDTAQASQQWRLKKSAQESFWDWVTSWARCASSPADLGYDGSAFVLPELKIIRHKTIGDTRAAIGGLFAGNFDATGIHAVKRTTLTARAKETAKLIEQAPDEPWIIWTDTDYEAEACKAIIPGLVEVKGAMTIEAKESAIERFLSGKTKLLTKPSVCGAGLNFQHCRKMIYVGRSFSYEAFYQSVRRCWRFGQKRPVEVHLIVAEGEDQIGRVIDRKSADHDIMKLEMRAAEQRAKGSTAVRRVRYIPAYKGRFPEWLRGA